MMEFLTALYDSALSTWIRESETVWAFPTILTVHTFGMMTLVGLAWVIDLRLLGIGRTVPIGPLRPLFRLMWVAFWINFATGVLLFIGDPERKATSALFGLKLLLIIINLWMVRRLERAIYLEGPDPTSVAGRTKQLAIASAMLWAGTIFAGRLLGYQ
jgi:hypothetical protein